MNDRFYEQLSKLLLIALCWIGIPHARASVIISTPDPTNPFEISLEIAEHPPFVIAEKGVRHALKPIYVDGSLIVVGPEGPVPGVIRSYQCTLENGPAGMSVTEDGIVEWIPGMDDVGNVVQYTVRVGVIEAGEEIYSRSLTFGFTVLAAIPQLLEPGPIVSYEGLENFSQYYIQFSELDYSNEQRKLFRWSLIDPPAGVYITNEGVVLWPDDLGYAREELYTFRVRIDYETASGSVSDEVTYNRRVLPRAATHNYTDLRSNIVSPQSYGMLGFSTAAGDGWLAAGEPFPAFAEYGSGNLGRVRLWKASLNGNYAEFQTIQPEFGLGGEAFGASVSLSKKDGESPTRLAVGAPESKRIDPNGSTMENVGYVYIYACSDDGVWSKETRLNPPVTQQSLYFGAWVSIHGNTLIASMEGLDTAGANTGALAVYRRESAGWVFSQLLDAPEHGQGDYFSYPSALSEGWIAAAANEDDDQATNAGAVHLFQEEGAQFMHRQTIYAPSPEAHALFGERLLLHGPWLFVSSFREQSNRGAVHVYRLDAGEWSFQQTLESPFAEEGSAFGIGLSAYGDVLAVSAPGYVFRDSEINGSHYPWKGITLFQLEGNAWHWSRQVTDCPDSTYVNKTWGFSLVQLSEDMTVASIPDHQAQVNGQNRPLAGRLFLHVWPEIATEPFAEVLSSLPDFQGQPSTANGDSNQNGVPNIIDWMMGQDPGAGPDSWTARIPQSKKPFIRMDAGANGMRFMVPQIRSALGHRTVIEISENLIDWAPVVGARWESPETITYILSNDSSIYSRTTANFHPVFIPLGENSGACQFVRLSVVD